jgi:putative transposase
MSDSASPSSKRRYGLARVTRIWKIARSTVYHWRTSGEEGEPRARRGPKGPCTDAELVERARKILEDSPFHGEGHRKVWARLRHQGVRTSKRRTLRVLREHGLLAPQRTGRPHGPKAHDGTITTDRPDEMWGTDQTSTVTVEEGEAQVFVNVDHCTGECLGIHASKSGNRFEALEPVRQAVTEVFGSIEKGIAAEVALRHDHGSNYMSYDFQTEVDWLGIESSPSFVREPEGNGVAERFIRTLKENLLWVRTFNTIRELLEALYEFRRTYNEQWLMEKHGYKTPSQVRRELAGEKAA